MSSAPTTHLTGGSTLLQPLDAPQPKLEGEALMDALRQQLDFYFSRNNLLSDSFLLSHMNANRSVPLEIVANFRKIRALTEDRQSIVKALQRCQNCAADKDGVSVKVTWKVERTTLILRDLPATISSEELKKSIFERDGSPAAGRIKEVRLEVGDNWFVTFDSEATTLATADWLMSQTYNGKPIPARVKSENLLRGFYYPTPKTYTDVYTGNATPISPKAGAALNVNVTVPLGNSNVNSVNVHASVTSNMPMNGAYAGYAANMYGHYGNGYYPYPYPYGAYNQYANGKNGQNQQRRPNQGGKKGKKGQEDGSVDVASPSLQSNTTNNESIEGEGKKKKKGGNTNQQPQQQGPRRKSNQIADPLFAAPMMGFDAAFAAPFYPPAIPLIQPNPPNRANLGYKKQYKHYSREQLAAIVDAVSSTNYSKPDGLSKVDDPEGIIVRQEPLKKTTITEPMPVIYPASPSPQLAAQPHHSSEMPFLDLMAGAHYLPFDPNFNQQQPQKKNTQKKQNTQKPKNTTNTNSSAPTNATNAAASAPTSTQSDQQPSAGKKKGKKNDENHHAAAPAAGSDEQKSKPPTAAAIVAASAHKQPTMKPVNKPQPSPAKHATAPTNNTAKETTPAASASNASTSPSSNTPAVSAPAAAPSSAPVGARPLVNYAARVGSLPPEEVAKRAKAVEDAKREKAKIEEEKKKKQLEEERKARGEHEEEKKEEKPAKSERKEKKKREKRERYEKREQKEEEKVADKAEEQKPAAPKPFSFADMVRKAATPNTAAPKAPSTEPKVAAPAATTATESKATAAAVVARNPSH